MGYVKDFFSNWKTAEGPVVDKLRRATKNRMRALAAGCCGHPGEPGC